MKQYELWIEGGGTTNYGTLRAQKVGTVHGDDFDDAVDKYVSSLPRRQATLWEYDSDDHCWKWCGQRAFDNETDACFIYG